MQELRLRLGSITTVILPDRPGFKGRTSLLGLANRGEDRLVGQGPITAGVELAPHKERESCSGFS